MKIRSLSDVIYTAIVWFPILAVLVFFGWTMMVGVVGLESNSYGTEHFVSNKGTVDPWANARESLDDSDVSGATP